MQQEPNAEKSASQGLSEFQPFLLSVSPIKKKHSGYGPWEVTCPRCGKLRTIRAYKYKATGKVRGAENMCHPCRAIILTKRIDLKCPSCGKIRVLTPADAKERLSSFCQSCVKATSLQHRSKNGIRHTNRTSRGYVVVLGMSGHPLARRNSVHEHWLTLYEQHPMGSESVMWFLKRGFTVHHKNGVRYDNSLDNLELRAPGKHPHGWTIEDMEEVVRRYRSHV